MTYEFILPEPETTQGGLSSSSGQGIPGVQSTPVDEQVAPADSVGILKPPVSANERAYGKAV